MNKQWPDDVAAASSAELAACVDMIDKQLVAIRRSMVGRYTKARERELEILEARRREITMELWQRHSVLKPTRKA